MKVLVMSKNVMEWVMEKVVINTTNNNVVICSNKNCNTQKWSISCHISKQGFHIPQPCQFCKCEFLSPKSIQEGEEYLCKLAAIRLQLLPTMSTEELRM